VSLASALSTQHSAFNTQRPTLNTQHSTLNAQHSALYADFHAQINEACVRYCLSRPRCDGPPARRVYSAQAGRESYLSSDAGCPLRGVCAWYQAHAPR
jgi:endonuclease-3 related protein